MFNCVQVEFFGDVLSGARPPAADLGALDEGLPVRLDAHGAAGLEDGVVRRGHGCITHLGPHLAAVVRPVFLHPGDDFLQV